MTITDGIVLYKLTNTGLKRVYGGIFTYIAGDSFFLSNDKTVRIKVAPVSGIVYRGALWLNSENDELAVELFDNDLLHQIKKQEEHMSRLNNKRNLIKKEIRG